ncbi:MAG: OmpH family outer membrane protein [Bergeyella sp.]
MKKLSAIFAIITMFAAGSANAQKIASMDYESVLSAMPEAKKLTTDLDAFSKAKGDELNKQAAAWQAEVEQYQKAAGGLTEAQRAAKEEELQKKQQNLQQLNLTAQTDLGKKREEGLKPIIDKINAAVEKVSKANGFDFVIDSSALIYKGGADATPLVKKELGI